MDGTIGSWAGHAHADVTACNGSSCADCHAGCDPRGNEQRGTAGSQHLTNTYASRQPYLPTKPNPHTPTTLRRT